MIRNEWDTRTESLGLFLQQIERVDQILLHLYLISFNLFSLVEERNDVVSNSIYLVL